MSHAAAIHPLRLTYRRLPKATTLELADATGTRIHCEQGTLWITQEDDRRDIIVGRGETFTVARNGLTLVHAVAGACVAIESPDAPRSLAHLLRDAASALLHRAWVFGNRSFLARGAPHV